eukprot:424496_1
MMNEEITADYWKGIVKGVVSMLIATLLFTTQTSIVKWGSMIGYTAAVILIFRGLIQFICCFIEATVSTQPPYFNMYYIVKDIKKIGIIPRRTIIPFFANLSNKDLSDYGSFKSTTSYSLLSPPTDINNSNSNLNINNSDSQIQNGKNDIKNGKNGTIKVIQNRSDTPLIIPTKNVTIQISENNVKKSKTKSYKCLIWSAIILRGVFGGVGTLLLFQASMLLPVGDMQSLMALTAAITPFLGFLFFRDHLTKLHLGSLIGAIVGVILIVQPGFIFKNDSNKKGGSTLGYIYALLGAFTQSMIYICIQFARKVPVYMLTLAQSIFGVITGVIVLLYTNQLTSSDILWIDSWFDIGYILLLGCVGYIFLWLITNSGKYITSGVIALLLNLSIVWGYIVQIVVFGDTITFITIIGAMCMFVSAAVVSVDKISDAHKKSMSVIERNITTTVGV